MPISVLIYKKNYQMDHGEDSLVWGMWNRILSSLNYNHLDWIILNKQVNQKKVN